MSTDKMQTPENSKHPPKQPISVENDENKDALISPGFRSVAAMAGWDEQALLAGLVVEDTPEREAKDNKRINPQFKTPPVSSKRKRIAQRKSLASIPVIVLDMDDDDDDNETVQEGCNKSVKKTDMKKVAPKTDETKENVVEEKAGEVVNENSPSVSSSSSAVPCMDRLREELSCAICLEICFEPSTTSCGHSFCKKCLQSATERCGKRCPKCRQLISNGGRHCTVNTVLWNTIQLLFPQEVEARKAAEPAKTQEIERRIPGKKISDTRSRSTRASEVVRTDDIGRSRRGVSSQARDAALALQLQREEFMEVIRDSSENPGRPSISAVEHPRRPSMSAARENLRAMASRAMTFRGRRRPT